MKSYVCHYRNKYPSGMVKASENELIVHDKKGDLCVYLQKSGAGQLKDVSEEYGAEHRHDLSPIPKAARFMKLLAVRINNAGSAAGKFAVGQSENAVANVTSAASLGDYRELLYPVQDYSAYFPAGQGLVHDFLFRDFSFLSGLSPSKPYLFFGAFDTSIHALLICQLYDL